MRTRAELEAENRARRVERAASELDLAHLKPRSEGQLAGILIATVRAGRQSMGW